jgi:hypothetical protein
MLRSASVLQSEESLSRVHFESSPPESSPAFLLYAPQSCAVWAGVMQGLVMQKDFRGGNIPIVGYLETGLGR